MLQSMGSQRIRHELVTEEQQQNSEVEVLTPNMMVFGDETLGRQIGLDEVISPYDGTGALIKG